MTNLMLSLPMKTQWIQIIAPITTSSTIQKIWSKIYKSPTKMHKFSYSPTRTIVLTYSKRSKLTNIKCTLLKSRSIFESMSMRQKRSKKCFRRFRWSKVLLTRHSAGTETWHITKWHWKRYKYRSKYLCCKFSKERKYLYRNGSVWDICLSVTSSMTLSSKS